MRRRHVAVFLVLSLGIAEISWAQKLTPEDASDSKHGSESESAAPHSHGDSQQSGFQLLVNPGIPQDAIDYYNRIEAPLGVIFIEDVPPVPAAHKATDLNGLLNYLGYLNAAGDGLNAGDLEAVDSFGLMPRNAAEFAALDQTTGGRVGRLLALDDFWDSSASASKVLVTRFFAPKIATYYDRIDPFTPINSDDIVPGWRKVVRLRPRAGSGAAAVNLKYAYILFNFKKANADENPFIGNESANNQVILVPTTFNPATQDSCYFAVYQSKSANYALGLFLAADFDLPGHAALQASGGVAADSEYYVPKACAACHGHGTALGEPGPNGVFSIAKANYLDTDQWYDWMDFDFSGVAGSLNDVVFDGGKDQSSPDYQRALDVFGALNLGIEDDTESTELTTTPSFALQAVRKFSEAVFVAGLGASGIRRLESRQSEGDATAEIA
mgnify:CR=1 FL=1